jgi:hypothetical protein
MTPDKREIVGGVSVVMVGELLVVITIMVAAAIGVNIGAITHAIAAWEIFQ